MLIRGREFDSSMIPGTAFLGFDLNDIPLQSFPAHPGYIMSKPGSKFQTPAHPTKMMKSGPISQTPSHPTQIINSCPSDPASKY